MQISKLTEVKADHIVQILKQGGVVIIPTETCYGLAADASNELAVAKIRQFKAGLIDFGIPILVRDKEMAGELVEINSTANNIYDQFLPGPVSVISKSLSNLASGVASPEGTQAVRISNYQFIKDLFKQIDFPITATAANISGMPTPYNLQKLLANLPESKQDLIDLCIDAGELEHNPPTTMINASSDNLVTVRQGQLEVRDLQSFESSRVEETIRIAKELTTEWLGQSSKKPILIMLNGALGAGKTHFAKGIALALGITERIKSPTYTYEIEYEINKDGYHKFFHLDPWRLNRVEDINLLWRDELFASDAITVVEWPEVFGDQLQQIKSKDLLVKVVTINYAANETRNIIVSELK